MLTKQKIFDRVARHLLTQNKKAWRGNVCSYRDTDGLTCAVGCLIPPERYEARFEGLDISRPDGLDSRGEARAALYAALHAAGVDAKRSERLLRHLQSVHDDYNVEEWPEDLARVACAHGLSAAVLDEFGRGDVVNVNNRGEIK